MGTKNNPGKFDCYREAEPDEPMFVLLARDPGSAVLVEEWAIARKELIVKGIKPVSDLALVKEALECAKAMRMWRVMNWRSG